MNTSLILITIFLSVTQISLAQNYDEKINIEQVYTDSDKEYAFGVLTGVASDSQQNLYMFDFVQNAVLKLNKQGKYLGKVIRDGRGPSEISSIYSYLLDEKSDRIYIADRQNLRYLVTDLKGDEIASHNITINSSNVARGMKRYNDDTLVLIFYNSKSQLMRQNQGIDSLIHFYNRSSFERMFSIADRENFSKLAGYESEAQSLLNMGFVGKLEFHNSSTLLISPYVYNQKVIVYKKQEDDTWAFSETIDGKKWDTEPFIEIDYNDYRNNRSHYRAQGHNIISATSEDGQAAGIMKLRSAGLFKLNSGGVVNFIVQEEKRDDTFYHILFAEYYDVNLNHINSENIFEGENGEVIQDVSWMDKNENFYLLIGPPRATSEVLKFTLK